MVTDLAICAGFASAAAIVSRTMKAIRTRRVIAAQFNRTTPIVLGPIVRSSHCAFRGVPASWYGPGSATLMSRVHEALRRAEKRSCPKPQPPVQTERLTLVSTPVAQQPPTETDEPVREPAPKAPRSRIVRVW